MHFSEFIKENFLFIIKIIIKVEEPEKLNIFGQRRHSPNFCPPISKAKESVVSYLWAGGIFCLEESFTENPKTDKNMKTYKCKVVRKIKHY